MENNEYVVTEEVQEEVQEEPKKKKGLFGHTVEEEPGKHSKYAVLSAKTYFWSIFIMSIPALGWLIAIIWACGLTRNKNRSNLAKPAKPTERKPLASFIKTAPPSETKPTDIKSSSSAAPRSSLLTKSTAGKPSTSGKLVALACSTGGPKSLQEVIPMLPKNLDAPVVLVQHMPKGFTLSLAQRLDTLSEIKVSEAVDGEVLESGHVYIAPGGMHITVVPCKEGHMIKYDNGYNYGIPMVTVYLLGHRVGDIEEPILYVRHKSFDYYGNVVTKGHPNPFVESLVHDSIIVQIPLLRGQKSNRLEKILSIFDQTNKDKYNTQVLNIEENDFCGDADMERIMHRLLVAASNSKVRQDMNVEEEYFMAIENRDTAIMKRDKRIKELDLQVSEREAQINEQNAQINEQTAQINEQTAQINEQNAQINEQNAQINEQNAQINEQNAQINEQNQALITSAKALKKTGFSVEDIAKMTKLPIDIVRDL